MSKVLVADATGHLGRELLRELKEQATGYHRITVTAQKAQMLSDVSHR